MNSLKWTGASHHVYLIQPERTNDGGVSCSFLPSWFFFSAVDTVLSRSECLTVHVVPRQILMSACCQLRAPREYVQTRRVPSHASHVNPVTRSPRMDSSVMVRLLAVSIQDCAFVCLYAWAQARVCVCVSVCVHITSFSVQTCKILL